MALSFQLPLSRLHLVLPSSISYPPHVFNMFPKAHSWQFAPSRSRCRSAYVRIGTKDGTASGSVQIHCIAQEEGINEGSGIVKDKSVSVVLLAGGKGKRMGVNMPKQYLSLLGKPIALYSFYTFSELCEVKEIIVVCDPFYKDVFEDACEEIQVDIKFALPGKERQDSVFSGLQEVDESSELVCVHDSARPLVLLEDVKKVLKDGWLNGAAVLGVPVKATIKEANNDFFVVRTLDRKTLWEMQTPQVIKTALLRAGFELVNRVNYTIVSSNRNAEEHRSRCVGEGRRGRRLEVESGGQMRTDRGRAFGSLQLKETGENERVGLRFFAVEGNGRE